MRTSPTSSPPTPELAACPVLDELTGWVTIQSVLDTLVALKIDLARTPGSSATAVLTATATVDAAIRELKGACVIASRDLGPSGAAARYFDVINLGRNRQGSLLATEPRRSRSPRAG